MADLDFDALVASMGEALGWRRLRTAADYIHAWRSFVTECENGFSMSIYEFENDRSVRRAIEVLLNSEGAVGSIGFDSFRNDILIEDERYRALLQPDVHVLGADAPWWERGVPRYAGRELAADFADLHGVSVEPR
jgi:hypothetical protein